VQYGKTWRTIAKLSLPDKYLRATADNAPETRSESMFAALEPDFAGADPATGRRRGLKTAIATVRAWRSDKRAKRNGGNEQTAGRDDLAA
jgi:linoleoyl-CoA desaturase